MGSKRDSYSSDRELVDRALRGDEEATGAIARMLSDLTSLALRKLHSRGVAIFDPQNLAAEVSFQILVQDPRSALGRYRGESALRTFLWQVVRYKVIDRVRGQKLRPSLPLEDAPPIASPPPADRYRDIVRCLFDYLDAQAPAVRLVLEGRWVQELSYAEIADRIRKELEEPVSLETIGNMLFEHRKKFWERLKNLGLVSD